jgi:hypothetical protein
MDSLRAQILLKPGKTKIVCDSEDVRSTLRQVVLRECRDLAFLAQSSRK